MTLQEISGNLEEIRPGRTVFVRRIFIGDLDQDPSYTLVFVHGICGSEIQFQSLVDHLDQTLSKIHVKIFCLSFDSVGCGRSPVMMEWTDYQKSEIVSDLRAVMQKHLTNLIRVILIGHSFGPNIFLSMIATGKSSGEDPVVQNLAGCVFLGSSLRSPRNPQKDFGHPIMRMPLPFLTIIQNSLTNAFVEMAVDANNVELKEQVKQESNKNNMFVAKAYHRQAIWANEKELAYVQKLPALVIHGANDGIIPVVCAKELSALLPHSELVIIDSASHLVMIEKAGEVSNAILSFLQRLQTQINIRG